MKPSQNKNTILLIEDEMPLMHAVQSKLRNSGYEAVTARTVDQALGYLKDGIKIEAIWLDHFLLGNKTGIDFLGEIKNHKDYKKVPVFVVANTGGPDTEHSYLQLGVAKYYVKSNHRLDEIIQEVSKTINNKSND